MPTTKAQREAACAIIEKFTDDVVTFPVEFVLALLNDAEKLEDAIKDRYEAIRERDAAIADAVAFSNMYKEAEHEFEQLKRTYFSMLEDAGASSVQEIIDERDRLAERVRELEIEFTAANNAFKAEADFAEKQTARAKATEAKLAVAVGALEYVSENIIYVDDFERDDMGGVVSSAIAEIKGAP